MRRRLSLVAFGFLLTFVPATRARQQEIAWVPTTTALQATEDLQLFQFSLRYYKSLGLSDFEAAQLASARCQQDRFDRTDAALRDIRTRIGYGVFDQVLANYGVRFQQ